MAFKDVDDYINKAPEQTRSYLRQVREIIKGVAPDVEEKISYQMPTFFLNGNLVHFAAFKGHIGFYPTPSGIEAFKQELSVYEGAKGSVQFPLDRPMPLKLVTRIVKYRVAENLKKPEKNRRRKNS